MEYRCEAASVEGFVQQLAASYLPNGYWFYVAGWVPARKDPRAVDAKLIARYGVGISKWERARRKRAGSASVQYLRYGRFFLLLATHGRHTFFEQEAAAIRDARRVPIRFHGYSISHRGGHAHVRIEQREYNRLKAYFLELAVRRTVEGLIGEFGRILFEPYAPIRRQLLAIWRAVNEARRTSGLAPVPKCAVRLRRHVVPTYMAAESADAA
jgi:hypothetical protein